VRVSSPDAPGFGPLREMAGHAREDRSCEPALEAVDEEMKDGAGGTARNVQLERRVAEAERTVGKLPSETELWERRRGGLRDNAHLPRPALAGRGVAPVATIDRMVRVGRQEPWHDVDQVELATMGWVTGFHQTRVHR
jgi:hypothetical protein